MGNTRLFGALLTAATLWATASSAQVDTITINAVTCNPLPASQAKLSRRVTGWRFLGTAVGDVEFFCALPTIYPASGVNVFELVYTDTNGTAPGAFVFASIRQVADTTAATSLIATINSNDSSAIGPTTRSVYVNHSYDLFHSSYYVRVIMGRSVATQNPEFRAVRLTSPPLL